jgi:hypothetical protein
MNPKVNHETREKEEEEKAVERARRNGSAQGAQAGSLVLLISMIHFGILSLTYQYGPDVLARPRLQVWTCSSQACVFLQIRKQKRDLRNKLRAPPAVAELHHLPLDTLCSCQLHVFRYVRLPISLMLKSMVNPGRTNPTLFTTVDEREWICSVGKCCSHCATCSWSSGRMADYLGSYLSEMMC